MSNTILTFLEALALIGINRHMINYHSQMPFAGAPKVIVIYLWSVFLNDEYAEC